MVKKRKNEILELDHERPGIGQCQARELYLGRWPLVSSFFFFLTFHEAVAKRKAINKQCQAFFLLGGSFI